MTIRKMDSTLTMSFVARPTRKATRSWDATSKGTA